MIKLVSLISRKDGMSKQGFMHLWKHEHAAMAKDIPGLRRYVLSYIQSEPTRPDVPEHDFTCDGIVELWFDDEAQMQLVLASDAMREWRAHGATFIGRIKAFLTKEEAFI